MQTSLDYTPTMTDGSETTPIELLMDSAFITKAAECVKYAKRRIWITAYTWKWYENAPADDIQKFNYNVAMQVKKGLDVRALLDMNTQAQYLRAYGIQAKSYPTDRTLHTKAILIDDETLILGSHNLTKRATNSNYELSIIIKNYEAAQQYGEYFRRMWQNYGE